MAEFLRVPVERLSSEALQGLLEEFASRDGTDYGDQETPLDTRVAQLRERLDRGLAWLLFDTDSETWDLLPVDVARERLDTASAETTDSP